MRSKGISFLPSLVCSSCFSQEFVENIPPGAKLFSRSRDVISSMVKSLGLSAGDVILVPASLCWDALEPLLSNGIIVRCYALDSQLFVDECCVKKLVCQKTKAVYLVHYFGYPQPSRYKIRQLCDSIGLKLIEDCALCLFSNSQDLGCLGDVSFFSLWKYFPIPDGAIGLAQNGVELLKPVTHQNTATVIKRLLTVVLRSSNSRYLIARKTIRKLHSIDFKPPESIGTIRFDNQIAMSRLSKIIYSRCNIKWVAEKRRINYQAILNGIKQLRGVKPLWDSIPHDFTPFCFPIKLRDPMATQVMLQSKMIETEISINKFFKNHRQIQGNLGDFAATESIADQVLSLPVHQGLTPKCVNNIIKALHECA